MRRIVTDGAGPFQISHLAVQALVEPPPQGIAAPRPLSRGYPDKIEALAARAPFQFSSQSFHESRVSDPCVIL